jgi:hypothetical protein
METFTDGMILPKEAPASTTIVRRPVLNPQEETDEKSSELVAASKLEWRWKLGPEISVPAQKPSSSQNIEALTAPASECVKLLQRLGELFGETCDYDKYNQMVGDWVKNHLGNVQQDVNVLEQAKLIGSIERFGVEPLCFDWDGTREPMIF